MMRLFFAAILMMTTNSVSASDFSEDLIKAKDRLEKQSDFENWLDAPGVEEFTELEEQKTFPAQKPKYPKYEAISKLCEAKPALAEASKSFKIDPKILGSCLLAERSLQIDQSDAESEVFACTGLTSKPSVGVPQINISLAESFRAKKLHTHSDSNVKKLFAEASSRSLTCNELNAPNLWPYYMAIAGATIEKAWRPLLKEKGSLQEQVGTYCTIYRLSNWRSRARKRPAQVKQGLKAPYPQTSFYGFFAEVHLPLVKNLLEGDGCEDPETALNNHEEEIETQIEDLP